MNININKVFNLITEAKTNPLKRSVLINLAMKPLGLVISLFYTPMLFRYLTLEQYGIWVTIMSILNWINYFDVGIGNGFRNVLTEDIAKGNYRSAKSSVATAYISILIIAAVVFLIAIGVGFFIDWQGLLNTTIYVQPILFVTFIFICINFVLSLRNIECYAIQRSELVAITGIISQLINLGGIVILGLYFADFDKLYAMSILFGVSSLSVNVIFSLLIWRERDYLVPRIRFFDKSKLKSICGIGIKFFLLQICAMVIWSTDNVLVSFLYGPAEVAVYNTVFRIYNVSTMLFVAMMVPFWSKFTEAGSQGDFEWIYSTLKKLKKIWAFYALIVFASIFICQPLSDLWLHKHLEYGMVLIVTMAMYSIVYAYGNMFASLMNGISEIDLQLKCSIIVAVVNIPLSVCFAKYFGMGSAGICAGTVLPMMIASLIYEREIPALIEKVKRRRELL